MNLGPPKHSITSLDIPGMAFSIANKLEEE